MPRYNITQDTHTRASKRYQHTSDAHTHAIISPYEARLYNKIGKRWIFFAYFYALLCKYLHILLHFMDFYTICE
ncbi:hypothetical protein [Helicobacter sp. T3_23-1059]